MERRFHVEIVAMLEEVHTEITNMSNQGENIHKETK